jgi:hypothetical protein
MGADLRDPFDNLNLFLPRSGFKDFASDQGQMFLDMKFVTITTPAVSALKSAATTIPIVIPNAIDAVGAGLVASLDNPVGNVRGGTLLQAELSLKRLD